MTFLEFVKRGWARLIATAFAMGLLGQAVTVYYYDINFGWEVWLEVILVVGLLISVWVIREEAK